MVAYSSGAEFRANGSSIAIDFSRGVVDALWLDDLVTGFSDAISAEGAISHSCFERLGDERIFLFGADDYCLADLKAVDCVRFPITGWDERSYEVEIALAPGFLNPERKATLHVMSVLYLCRGLALVDACDDSRDEKLTEHEAYCLDQQRSGRCYIDIGEDLGRSAQAVEIYVDRAERKVRRQ